MVTEKVGARNKYHIYIGLDTIEDTENTGYQSRSIKHSVLETESWNQSREVYEALMNLVDVMREVEGIGK